MRAHDDEIGVGLPGEMEKFWALGHLSFTTQLLVTALNKRTDTVGEPISTL
jgi:hypothetical protein